MTMDNWKAENRLWLLKSRYADLGTTFRTVWDLYIKFYTVFLTFNIAALGFFLSKGSFLAQLATTSKRYIYVLVLVFAVQSALLCGTSILMAKYSTKAAADQKRLENELLLGDAQAKVPGFESVFPLGLARWAALANATVMLGMVAIWVSMFKI
jgi:hypothetical protein